MTTGRCSLTDNPYDFTVNGDVWSFTIDIVTTAASDINEMKARRQQLVGLVDNRDEEIIPVTWSEDSTFDGFYRVQSVSVPSTPVMLSNGYIEACQFTLERVTGYGNPLMEVTTQAVVRTNAHGYTVPQSLIAMATPATYSQTDLRPNLTAATSGSRIASDGQTLTVYTLAAPVALTQYRVAPTPVRFYSGAALIEIKYGSTWYQVVGQDIPRNTVWRISNGLVRLTSADAATPGTFEVWDNTAGVWESISITHRTAAAAGPGIGIGNGSEQAPVTILRNSPEQVTVRCLAGASSSALGVDFTYTLQRGARSVVASWTSASTLAYGAGFASVVACTAVASGSIRATANDAGGNRLVFAMPVAITSDLVNGLIYAAAAATSGSMMIGVEFGGSAAATIDLAANVVDQFFGAVAWRQRVIIG